jgi:hypothetical protein
MDTVSLLRSFFTLYLNFSAEPTLIVGKNNNAIQMLGFRFWLRGFTKRERSC